MDKKYKIPGMVNLFVDKNLVISNTEGTVIKTYSKTMIELNINGIKKFYSIALLFKLGYYDVVLPKSIEKYFYQLKAVEVIGHSDMKDDLYVVFRNPVVFKKNNIKYRVIARYPSYAINEDGTSIINIKTMRELSISSSGEYKSTALQSAGKDKRVVVHRLVAMAWCLNENPIVNKLVNHIDGDKMNNHYTNLEWCTVSHNIKHALLNGLRTDNKVVLSRDISTGEVVEHVSIREASTYIGRSPIYTTIRDIGNGVLWTGNKGIFELKYRDDKNPWYSVNENDKDSKIKRVTIDGNTYIVKDVRALIDLLPESPKKDHMLNAGYTYSYKEVVNLLNDAYPDLIINFEVGKPSKKISYMARNVVTGEIIKNDNLNSLAKLLGVAKSSAIKSSASNGSYSYNNWQFKPDDGSKFNKCITIANKPMKLILTNMNTNVTVIVDSLRKAKEIIQVDRKYIKKAIVNGTVVRGFKVSYNDTSAGHPIE